MTRDEATFDLSSLVEERSRTRDVIVVSRRHDRSILTLEKTSSSSSSVFHLPLRRVPDDRPTMIQSIAYLTSNRSTFDSSGEEKLDHSSITCQPVYPIRGSSGRNYRTADDSGSDIGRGTRLGRGSRSSHRRENDDKREKIARRGLGVSHRSYDKVVSAGIDESVSRSREREEEEEEE